MKIQLCNIKQRLMLPTEEKDIEIVVILPVLLLLPGQNVAILFFTKPAYQVAFRLLVTLILSKLFLYYFLRLAKLDFVILSTILIHLQGQMVVVLGHIFQELIIFLMHLYSFLMLLTVNIVGLRGFI